MMRVYSGFNKLAATRIMTLIDVIFDESNSISGRELHKVHDAFGDIADETTWTIKYGKFFCAPAGNDEFTIYIDDPDLDEEDQNTETDIGQVAFDAVSNPSHYCEGRLYEPRKVIHDWGLNFNLGNAVKYIARAGRKGSVVEDLEKAIQYIEFEIEELTK